MSEVNCPCGERVNCLTRVNICGKCGRTYDEKGTQVYWCPKCDMISYHPEDILNNYCGNCHKTRQQLEAEEV